MEEKKTLTFIHHGERGGKKGVEEGRKGRFTTSREDRTEKGRVLQLLSAREGEKRADLERGKEPMLSASEKGKKGRVAARPPVQIL